MAIRHEGVPSNVPAAQLDPSAPPYRRFRSRPLGEFVQAIATEIARTGRPENCDGLYRGKLPKSAKYSKLRKIEINPKKRDGDMAPCPMCTPNRFLHGDIIWCYELQVVSVIGHCCADHAKEAERQYKAEDLLWKQENYLLEALPLIAAKVVTTEKLRPAALEAWRVYRLFRGRASHVQKHLRDLKERAGGRLRVFETIKGANEESSGPAGFSRNSDRSLEHDFGHIDGLTALIGDYRPHVELDDLVRTLSSLETGVPGQEVNFIADMTYAQRRAAVALIQGADARYAKFISRIEDFKTFFTKENIDRLNRYGTSAFQHFAFEARYGAVSGRPLISILHRQNVFKVALGADLEATKFAWIKAEFA